MTSLRDYATHKTSCAWWWSPAPSTTVLEQWESVDVGLGVLYAKCPRCSVARVAEWCPPPCNTQSARYQRMRDTQDNRKCTCGLSAILEAEPGTPAEPKKCPHCKEGVNSREQGGSDTCFHCDKCAYIGCMWTRAEKLAMLKQLRGTTRQEPEKETR